jgi:hypothetical protein
MNPLFTHNQLIELVNDRYKIRKQKIAERLEPFSVFAVKFYANQMRPASQRILDDLKYSDWAYAFEFHSYDFSNITGSGYHLRKWIDGNTGNYMDGMVESSHYDYIAKHDPDGTLFRSGDQRWESMWSVWCWTDFRKNLLTELGLDPEQFEFKLISWSTLDNKRLFKNNNIPEYINKVELRYKKATKKKDAVNCGCGFCQKHNE